MHSYTHNVMIMRDSEAVSVEVTERFACAAVKSVARHGRFCAAIPGGSSPRRVFELLSSGEYSHLIPWDRTHIFFTDERCVPPDHTDSNYRQANELLLSKVSIPQGNVHRFMSEELPDVAAEEYEIELRMAFGDIPALDFVILGMGADTHTASLFPNSPALAVEDRLAVANYVEKLDAFRLTLTFPMLNSSAEVIVMAMEAEKASAVREALLGEHNPILHPIQGIKPAYGRLLWVIDSAAAAEL
jgi:6-phosphogluconolactonase